MRWVGVNADTKNIASKLKVENRVEQFWRKKRL